MNDKTKKIHEERFLKTVADHRMEILRDDGVDRHIRFMKEDKSISYYFDIITVSGKLFITGDCGTWGFSRTTDMFDFFRTDKQDWNYNRDGGLSVNPRYWAEKLLCHDRNHSYEEFSEDVFEAAVKEMFDQYFQYEDDFSDEIKQDVWSSIEENVLNPDGEHDAYLRLQNFSYEHEDIAGRDGTAHSHSHSWIGLITISQIIPAGICGTFMPLPGLSGNTTITTKV